LEYAKSQWYVTPTASFADYTALNTLPGVDVEAKAASQTQGADGVTTVTVTNPSKSLAFAVHLKVLKGQGGEELLPVMWEDNYFALLPGETRQISATYRASDMATWTPVVEVDGWNVKAKTAAQ